MFHTKSLLLFTCFIITLSSCQDKEKRNVHLDSAKPHIIVIMADDVGLECFDAYAESEYKTPNITKLAREGKVFSYAYSQPLCTPSRMEIMTGKSNIYNYKYFELLPKGEYTFAHHLKQNGYRTCVGGKWQLTGISIPDSLLGTGMTPSQAGFDEHFVYQLHSKPKRYWGATYHFNNKEVSFPNTEYGPDYIVDEMVSFMERNAEQPMFLYYPMIHAHSPFQKTPFNIEEGKIDLKERYMGLIEYMDHLVGRLITKANDLGIRENTIFIFTTDNGTSKRITSKFGEREVIGGKGQTIDDGIHAPMIVNWKETIEPGQIDNSLVALYNIFPTLADIIGQPLAESEFGASFLPLLKDQEIKGFETTFGYFFPTRVAPRDNEEAIIFIQNRDWKLYADGRLIDKINDILEERPITIEKDDDQSRKVRITLKTLLDAKLSSAISSPF
jgi:arylsulfatase A-like enzyme